MKDFLWLQQASEKAYKAGSSEARPISHILMLWHRLPQLTGLVTESRICTSECHLVQVCLAACNAQWKTICQRTAKFGTAASMGCKSWEPWYPRPGWYLLPTGSEIQWEACTKRGCCHAAKRWHWAYTRGSFSQTLQEAGLYNPCFGKRESLSIAVLCCACFDCSLLFSTEMELDQ